MLLRVVRRLALPGLALLLAGPISAQKLLPPPIKFGSVTKDDFTPTAAADSAAAEVMCDFGQSRIVGAQDGFELLFERTSRLRIHRKAGYSYATVQVPLYHRDGTQEKLMQLKGFTYNLEPGTGKLLKTPMRTEAVFSRKRSEYVDEYAFTLPDVREGSILEFTYTVRSGFLNNLQDWQFQQSIPVRWSEYRAVLPSFFRYKEVSHTYWPFAFDESTVQPYTTAYSQSPPDSHGKSVNQERSVSISTQAVHRRWVLKDAPAFRQEPFLTTPEDYLSRVDFELERIQFQPNTPPRYLAGTWPEIEQELLKNKNFGGYLDQSTPLTSAATALRTTHPDPAARAAAARALVQQVVGYTGENRLYAFETPKKVCERRHGSAAEVNLLLIRTLRDAGLEAQPLLLSTRDNGRVQTELPVLTQLNYPIAYVPGLPAGQQLLDATDPTLPVDMLPEHCLNEQGRLLGPTGRWVPLVATQPHLQFTRATLQLDDAGALAGTIRQEYAGYAASPARRAGPDLLVKWQKDHPDWTVKRREETATAPGTPLVLALDAHLPAPEAAGRTLYVRPLQTLAPTASPFQTEDRRYPVDLPAPRRAEYQVTLTLPQGYTATTLPTDANLSLPGNGGRFIYSISQPTPQTLAISSRLLLTKTHYQPEEYAALRALYAQALAKMAEPIVVQKP
ncbi:DUF3857 domain-containing protein [Hymenobacter sp. APR13]|uniref:DUF3857 domain-containing protein n=1 Tax=Hymenobacter sp. APR13 TaxID=1356852 RepID=UPI0004E070A2|nr:DUF3857 domain-containing protein [Hymenobacter sp. APR13]AII51180.1 hypothetical protein N008_04190 [Hymenobacter sp. APR13]